MSMPGGFRIELSPTARPHAKTAPVGFDGPTMDELGDVQDAPHRIRKTEGGLVALKERDQAGDDVTEGVACEGYLRKRYSSSMYMGSWRYCVLQGNRLRWYMTEELAHRDSQLRGEVWVQSLEAWDGMGTINVYPFPFAIRTTGKRLLLCSAPTEEDKHRWTAKLAQCVGKARDAAGHGTHDEASRRIVPEDMMRAIGGASPAAGSPAPPSSAAIAAPAGPGGAPLSLAPSSAPPLMDFSPVSYPILEYGYPTSGSMGQVPTSDTMVQEEHFAAPSPSDLSVATSSSSKTSACTDGDLGCADCGVRFKALIARRHVCGSCAGSFCSRHCSRQVKLQHLGLRSTRRCCDECARRQDFVSYLRTMTRFLKPFVSKGVSMAAYVSANYTQRTKTESEVMLLERTLHKLRFGPMSLNRTIKILYQTRKKPHLFRVACERLPFYTENCIDRVENLWYQILHLFQCCDTDLQHSEVQLYYLKRYIRAICRRSARIALQTIWHVQASVGDANKLHPHSLLALLGFIYPASGSGLSRTIDIWKDLLLANCPEHQFTEIMKDLERISSQTEEVIAHEEDSMLEKWLNARTVGEFEACAMALSRSGVELCEFQSSILYDSMVLRPEPDREEEEDDDKVENDAESDFNQVESLVFEQVHFVQSLAAISERLRHVQPVEDRGKFLEAELEELNKQLNASALYPLCTASDELYQVVRIPPNEGKVFSTKMRAPTLIFVETIPVNANTAVDTDSRLRPFVNSSRPRNSTFFESAPAISILTDEEIRESTMSSESSTGGVETRVSKDKADKQEALERQQSEMSLPDLDSASSVGDSDTYSPDVKSAVGAFLGRHMTFPAEGIRGEPLSRGKIVGGVRNARLRLGAENMVYNSKVYGESWEVCKERIQSESPMGHLPGWNLFSVIVKTNDDLRQEVFTMQLINKFKAIFEFEQTNLWLRTYRILATGANIGLLETITDACSLDHLKKNFPGGNLLAYFKSVYGDPTSSEFQTAQRRFIESMAAYSVVSYVLLLKDRHNGNILLSSEGRIIHIDFGFILGIAPGGMFSIEDAPFKLTTEMVDVMGGMGSDGYRLFQKCLCEGFASLQKYQSEIVALLQTTGQHSPFPCFEGAKLARIISDLRVRLCVGLNKRQIRQRVEHLVRKSYNAWGTRQYDSFQLRSNNIHP
jgi:hypothetical protein